VADGAKPDVPDYAPVGNRSRLQRLVLHAAINPISEHASNDESLLRSAAQKKTLISEGAEGDRRAR